MENTLSSMPEYAQPQAVASHAGAGNPPPNGPRRCPVGGLEEIPVTIPWRVRGFALTANRRVPFAL